MALSINRQEVSHSLYLQLQTLTVSVFEAAGILILKFEVHNKKCAVVIVITMWCILLFHVTVLNGTCWFEYIFLVSILSSLMSQYAHTEIKIETIKILVEYVKEGFNILIKMSFKWK